MNLWGKLIYSFLAMLFCLVYREDTLAQNGFVFEKVGSAQGVHQSIIYGLAQDTFGNIWACTEDGVIRYNSQQSFPYNKYHGLPENFGNRIHTIYIDKKHRLFIGAEGGIALYNPRKDHFEWLKPPQGASLNLVRGIIEDQQGNIWIGSYNGVWKYTADGQFEQVSSISGTESLFIYNNRVFVGSAQGSYTLSPEELRGRTLTALPPAQILTSATVSCISPTGNQLLLGTKDQGLLLASTTLDTVNQIALPIFSTRNYPINDILITEDDHIYIATDGLGLVYLNENFEVINTFTNNVNDPNSISSNGVYDLLLDRESILWVATYGGGINMLNSAKNKFHNITHQINNTSSIAHNFSRSVLEDREGNIWFGTKLGISIQMKGGGQWKHLSNFSYGGRNLSSLIVMALEEDDDFMWAGTYGHGAFKIRKSDFSYIHYGSDEGPPRRIKLDKIYSILKDQKGNIWLGGIDAELQQITPEGKITSHPSIHLKDIINSQDGSILLAGRKGVQRVQNGKIVEISALSPSPGYLEYTTINCIYEDHLGNLLIGTNGAGLAFYQISSESVSSLSVNDGMPSDIVQGILAVDQQSVWVSTTRGLAQILFSEKDTSINIFDRTDGLASTEYNYGSYTKLSDGSLVFGGVNGLTHFAPEEISPNPSTPKIVFEEFRLFNKTINPGDPSLSHHINVVRQVELKASENAFAIRFVGILQSTPSKIKYSWKLEGFDENWSEPASENQTNFTNLPPGKYTFRVKAANRDGHWGPERQLAINILPPWWATTAAYFTYAILGILFIIGVIYITGLYVNKRNAEEQIAFFSNITHELKTPLTILLSSLETLPKDKNIQSDTESKIKGTVKRLNSLFEQLLNFHKVSTGGRHKGAIDQIPLESHLEKLVESFKPLLEDRNLTVQIEGKYERGIFYYTQEVFDKILFNLLSNAIKYSREGGHIKIKVASFKGVDLRIAISDEGIGIPKDQQKFILKRYYRGRNAINSQTPGTGLGLMMVKNLVEQDKGLISFTSVENVGSTFTVLLKNQIGKYPKSALVQQEATPPEDLYENSQIEEYSDAKVLLVEDNDELRHVLVNRLSNYFQVFEARNGIEGLEMVKQVFPDLILTDLIMPEMDGMTMCQELQKDINLNHIPIFMLTVLNNSIQKMESIENGISEYMEKPIDFNLLLAKMTNTLAWQDKLRQKYLHQTEIENAEKYRNKRDADFINGLEKFVLSQLNQEDFSIHDLCRHVGMSRTALYMKLKNLVDLSPQDFIIHARLRYARKLLVEKDIPIKEVAYKSGFSNPKYFSTSFKKIFGSSPSEFVKNLEAKDN